MSEATKNRIGTPSGKPLNPPSPSRQIAFHQLLLVARKQWLWDALSETLGQLDQAVIKAQTIKYVPSDVQKILAGAALRDERIFPLPVVLEAKPTLVGYYRLLLGSPQKSFYNGSTGMGPFKSMENRGTINDRQRDKLDDFCTAMARTLSELVRGIPHINERDVRDLPLLTYGAQLQGANNTIIGKQAMEAVFLAISEIVRRDVVKKEPTKLTVRNASGRTVVISLSHDPDVSVDEIADRESHRRLAIEVKGGMDISNVHNRAGEAEKSHQKAQKKGFKDFWTVISKTGVNMATLKQESPTSTEWFDISAILAREGIDWENFRQRFAVVVGIPL